MFPYSDLDMMSKELQRLHLKLFNVNLTTHVSKIITKYCQISPLIALWEPNIRAIF